MSLTSMFFVFFVTMLVLTLALIQGRSEPRRGPGYRDSLLEGIQLVQVTRSEVRGRRLMRLGRIISSLCCVEETDKTVTPFPENVLWVLFARFLLYLQLFYLKPEDESCSLSSIETRLLGFPGPSQLARLLPEAPVSC